MQASVQQPLLPLRRDHLQHPDAVQQELTRSKTPLKVCLVIFVVMALILPLLSFISELSVKALASQPPFDKAIHELQYRANYRNAAVS